MNKLNFLSVLFLIVAGFNSAVIAQKNYTLNSPNGKFRTPDLQTLNQSFTTQ